MQTNHFGIKTINSESYLIAPSIVSIFLQARIELSVERLKKRQVRLIEEWGDDTVVPISNWKLSVSFCENPKNESVGTSW